MKAMSSIAARDGYPMTLPIFGVGHSLGSKLQARLGRQVDRFGRRPPARPALSRSRRIEQPTAAPRARCPRRCS